jgi:hypothetical protein
VKIIDITRKSGQRHDSNQTQQSYSPGSIFPQTNQGQEQKKNAAVFKDCKRETLREFSSESSSQQHTDQCSGQPEKMVSPDNMFH